MVPSPVPSILRKGSSGHPVSRADPRVDYSKTKEDTGTVAEEDGPSWCTGRGSAGLSRPASRPKLESRLYREVGPIVARRVLSQRLSKRRGDGT